MVVVVLFQVRVARRVTDRRSAARVAGRAGWLMLAACAVYALSGGHLGPGPAVAVLLAAAAIQVFGEMMQGAAAWELGFGLAPADRQGQYQGLFGMGPQIARMLGPLLLTTLLSAGGRRAGSCWAPCSWRPASRSGRWSAGPSAPAPRSPRPRPPRRSRAASATAHRCRGGW